MGRFKAALVVVVSLFALQGIGLAQNNSTMGSSPQAAMAQPSITGTVAYRERIALPPDAAIDVKLQDVSLQDAPAKTIAETVFAPAGKQVPIPFQLAYSQADINPTHTYQVRATISVNGKLMFTSTTAYPVITNGAPSQIPMMLQQAQAPVVTTSGDQLRGTDWTLAELNGTAAIPGEGKSAHLKLHKKGNLTGSTGCNNLTGTYIAEQGALQITPGAMTLKVCTPPVAAQEQAFLSALKATTKYKIDGGTLEILNGEKVLAKFQAEAK